MPEENNSKSKKVPWIVFVWVIGVIFVALGWIFTGMTSLDGKVSKSKDEVSSLRGDIIEIKTNVAWIMEAMKQNKLGK